MSEVNMESDQELDTVVNRVPKKKGVLVSLEPPGGPGLPCATRDSFWE